MTTWHAIELGNYGTKVRTRAMRKGVAELGGTVLHCPHSDVKTLEIAVVKHSPMFAYTSGDHWTERAARAYLKEAGIPVVVMDLGYFKRAKDSQDREGYNQVGLERIGWVTDAEVDSSRWDALGISDAAPPVTGRPRSVLILGQVPSDSQHHLNETQLNAWYAEQVKPFRDAGYEIVFRPHPKAQRVTYPLSDRVDSGTLADALAKCSHVITYNSTAGLEAILAGVPVVCHESAHYASIATGKTHKWAATPQAIMYHMHRLAWSQWTCAEIEQGLPLQFLFPELKPEPAPPPEPMRYLVAIPYFGTNEKYRSMLDAWVVQLRKTCGPDVEFTVFTHDALDLPYPTLRLDISAYADVIRAGQPFDIKGALMCEAALAIKRPFLMIDSDALLVKNPSDILDAMGDTPCAMPVDHGAIVSGHKAKCDREWADVRKMCAGVFFFGDVKRRAELVRLYRQSWHELREADFPWTPRIPHLLEQYAWSLAHHTMRGRTLPASFNWAPHIVGESQHAVINHYFGHKKWNGKAPANT